MKLQTILLIVVATLFIQGKKSIDYSKVLPGVVKVNDHLYYDKSEITNISWLEYVSWNEKVHGTGSAEHLASFPDTNVWVQKGRITSPTSGII
ncbi:MAG: hypothetical protein R2813_13705 [Flavobacteriales bacterium]